jgi:hypothetical protein
VSRHPPTADLDALLVELQQAGVEHIIVGGAAAVLQGAPLTTQDLDIVHRRTVENVDRLMALLLRLDAYLRLDPAHRQLRPTRELLLGRGHINLSTSLGPLDPLCEIGDRQGYEELLPHSEVMTDGSLSLRVLDLSTLIDLKSRTGQAKDLLMLPVLIATLRARD